jgi:hypothetical protein
VSLAEFQSYGVGKGTPQEARSVVQKHSPSASVNQVINQVAYVDDLSPLPNLTPQQDDLSVLQKPAEFGSKALEQARAAITLSDVLKALEILEVYNKNVGRDKTLKDTYDQALDILLDRIHALLLNNKNLCLTKDDYLDQSMVTRLTDAKPGTFGAKMAKRFMEKYGSGTLEDMKKMIKSCVLRLHIKSQISADSPAAKYIIPVEGDIHNLKFGFSQGRTYLKCSGYLAYGPIQVIPHMEGNYTCEPWKPIHGESTNLTIIRLEPVFNAAENGQLEDFNLQKMTAVDDSGVRSSVKCTSIESGKKKTISMPISFSVGSNSIWLGYFNAAHAPEWELQGWTVAKNGEFQKDSSNDPIYGQYYTNNPGFTPYQGFGTWAEESRFVLTKTSGT